MKQAIELLVGSGRDISAVLPSLYEITNEHQVRAIRILLSYKTSDGKPYGIANKFPELFNFKNQHAVDALEVMLQHGRSVLESFGFLTRIDNEYQVRVIKGLCEYKTSEGGSYQIRNKFPDLLNVRSGVAAMAIESMLADGRNVIGSFEYLSRFTSPRSDWAAATIATLLKRKTFKGGVYGIDNKFPMIEHIDTELKYQAISEMLNAGVGVMNSMVALTQISTQEQLEKIRKFIKYKSLDRSIDFVLLDGSEEQFSLIWLILEKSFPAEHFNILAPLILLKVKSPKKIALMRDLIERGYQNGSVATVAVIDRILNPFQQRAIELIVVNKYRLAEVIDVVLAINSAEQIAFLETEIVKKTWLTRFRERYGTIVHPVFRGGKLRRLLSLCEQSLE